MTIMGKHFVCRQETLIWELSVTNSFKTISFLPLDEHFGMNTFHNGSVVFNEINETFQINMVIWTEK